MLARFRPYFRYLRPVRGKLIAAIILGAICGIASGAGIPAMVKWIFQPFFEATGAARLDTSSLIALLSVIPAVFGVRCLAQFLNSYLVAFCGTIVLEGLRTDLFAKFQRLPLGYFQKSRSGELLSRAVSDAQQAQLTLTGSANDLVVLPVTFLGSIGYIAYVAATEPGAGMFLLGLGVVPVCVLPIRFIGKNLFRRAQHAYAANGDVSELLRENLSAAREVRAFGLEEREKARFAAGVQRFFKLQMKMNKYAFALSPLIEFITGFGIAGALFVAYRAHTPWSSVISILPALYFCYDAMRKMGKLQTELTRGSAALDRLDHVLLEPEPIADPAQPKTLVRARGEIEFRTVSFTYGGAGAEEVVLREVSAHIPAGSVCALVGPSGAGKSTFANLVPRFYDATAGAVLVDGIDVRDLRLGELRGNIAVVSQDSFLFNDTIYNNLLLGRAGATRAEVEQAARDASAHAFIASFPQGYDTMVGERGTSLSGGQRQRIALARAFLRNAPILILDEATSALDSESEAAIQKALQKLVIGKTVLIIAHRFSTLRDASMILVFDRGRIIAQGPHAEVYKINPLYRGLYDQQQIG
jgi:subfamily B ATP-binding cassette protein MsbA